MPARQSVVEVLCDYVQGNSVGVSGLFQFFEEENSLSRALWYSFATYKPQDSKKDKDKKQKWDPYGEDANVFDIDVRLVRNVHAVSEALVLYWHDSRGEIWTQAAFEALLVSFGAADNDAQKKTAAVNELLRSLSPEALGSVHRLVLMVNALPDAETRDRASRVLGDAVLRQPTSSDVQLNSTRALREEAFAVLCAHATLPPVYQATPQREAQSRHHVPTTLAENEWAILLDGAEKVKLKAGQKAVEEGQEQTALYRVIEGSLTVTVGTTQVATLISLDWFGEMAFLGGAHVSRGAVTAEKRGAMLYKIPFGLLDAVLLSRPDLASKFYSVMAVESASRLNVALIKTSLAGNESNLALDPQSQNVPHALRTATEQRHKESGESTFLYEANTHAVRAWSCQRIPKKANKHPRDSMIFVYPTQLVNMYHKGHSEKKCIVPFGSVTEFTLEESGSRITVAYTQKKKTRSMILQFKDNATAAIVHAVTVQIRNAEPTGAPVKEFGPVSARAVFAYNTTRPNELRLSAGEKLTVLDQAGCYYYGFKTDEPGNKGLFAKAFVELRPIGVGVSGCMQANDWTSIRDHFVCKSFVKGDVVLAAGDHINAGHLTFVENGELLAQRTLSSGLTESLGFVSAGETIGELMFLLGGVPRATVTVSSDTAQVVTLPRSTLTQELLVDALFAAKFWKYLCCVLASRLMAVQARLAAPLSLPEPISFSVPEAEKIKAASLGSVPSMPELPPVAADPRDELIMRIKQRGAFFLGVDVPSKVDERIHSPREEGAQDKPL